MALAVVVTVTVLLVLLSLPLGEAQQRSAEAHPHGLPYENPLALSPAAFEFFHPGTHPHARHGHGVAPVLAPRAPLKESAVRGGSASVAKADQEEGGSPPARPSHGDVRAGTVAGVLVGVGIAAVVALGAAYVVARRRVHAQSTNNDVEAGAARSTG